MHRLSADQRAEGQTVTERPRASWVVALVVVVVDQLTKTLIARALEPGQSLPLLPPVLYLTVVRNTGAAFGLLRGQQWLFVVLSALVIAAITWELTVRPPSHRMLRVGCGLLLGGAIGNLIDRVRLGSVFDFIDLRVWPVFNVADSAITVGVTLFVWHLVFERHATRDKRQD